MAPPRARSLYLCGACGQQAPRWLGRCPGCGEWGSMVEEAVPVGGRSASPVAVPTPLRLAEVGDAELERIETGISELDRVLGGGLVPGSLVLIASRASARAR